MCRYDLSLSNDDTWAITPKEIKALMERKRVADRWQRHDAALVAHTVYMVNRGPKAKKLKIEDFMPQEAEREQTYIDHMNIMSALITH